MAAAQQTPLFRLSALFLVLAAAGLAALQRSGLVRPQDLLDLGLVFEIAGAFALSLMENALAWPRRSGTRVHRRRGLDRDLRAGDPEPPWKSITAAIVSAAMVPCAHLLAAQILGYPAMPWNRLASYTLGPACRGHGRRSSARGSTGCRKI